MLDIIISALLAVCTARLGYLGMRLTLHPPRSDREEATYKYAFIIVGALSICLIVWQGIRTANSQQEFKDAQVRLEAVIQEEKKAAHSSHNELINLREQTNKLQMDLAKESGRREEAEKNMALTVQRAGVDTRVGVAEDIRKSPIKIDVAPGKEAIKMSFNLLTSATGDNPPYETKFIATVNQIITPVRLVIQCESEILQANGTMLGVGVHLGGGWGGRFSINQFGLGILSPPWSPATPMVITVKSSQRSLGTCRLIPQ